MRRENDGRITRPFAQKAGVRCRGSSKRLRRAMVDFGADYSFAKAAGKLKEHYGLDLAQGRVKSESLRTAKTLPQNAPVARLLASKGPGLIVAEADGTMIPIVQTTPAKQTPGQGKPDRRKHRKAQWKEAKLVAAQAHGSARAWYGAGLDNPEASGARWTQAVRQAGCAQATQVHGVGDGAEWIAGQFRQHFGARGKYLLDLWHVCEHLAPCAPAGEDNYLEKTREALRANKAAQVIEELASRLERPEVPDEEAPVRRAHRYLGNRREQLDYKAALEKDLPVGSGLIESGHRHVLQARLKISGAWWREDNAHAMIQLRVCRANGLWPQLWQT